MGVLRGSSGDEKGLKPASEVRTGGMGTCCCAFISGIALFTPRKLLEKAKVLDNFYVPTRYPNGHPAGAPFEHYGQIRVIRR